MASAWPALPAGDEDQSLRPDGCEKKPGVLIGEARKLPERQSDRYCFWEFDNQRTSSDHLLQLALRSSEGATH
jgi:hypothetical protein